MSINIEGYYFSRELIVGCLAVNGMYVMHFQDENKFNVWTMYKNDGGMGKRLLNSHCKSIESLATTTCKLLLEIYV